MSYCIVSFKCMVIPKARTETKGKEESFNSFNVERHQCHDGTLKYILTGNTYKAWEYLAQTWKLLLSISCTLDLPGSYAITTWGWVNVHNKCPCDYNITITWNQEHWQIKRRASKLGENTPPPHWVVNNWPILIEPGKLERDYYQLQNPWLKGG